MISYFVSTFLEFEGCVRHCSFCFEVNDNTELPLTGKKSSQEEQPIQAKWFDPNDVSAIRICGSWGNSFSFE